MWVTESMVGQRVAAPDVPVFDVRIVPTATRAPAIRTPATAPRIKRRRLRPARLSTRALMWSIRFTSPCLGRTERQRQRQSQQLTAQASTSRRTLQRTRLVEIGGCCLWRAQRNLEPREPQLFTAEAITVDSAAPGLYGFLVGSVARVQRPRTLRAWSCRCGSAPCGSCHAPPTGPALDSFPSMLSAPRHTTRSHVKDGVAMAALEQLLVMPGSTTFDIANRTISAHIGPAFGIIAWSAGTAAGLESFGRQFKRGEMTEYTAVLAEAREIALERLVAHGQALGADAIVGLRFDSNTMGESSGLVEILALGSAVTLAGSTPAGGVQ
ncbi:MAG: heavy metal-binding domain-containing protein [Actinobacteria bacterium]|nr:heavy metal-binding domain-containing protein [Actinomycetota bacterium]